MRALYYALLNYVCVVLCVCALYYACVRCIMRAYSASNAVIEWLLVVKMLETEIHLFRYSAILLFRIPPFPESHNIIASNLQTCV